MNMQTNAISVNKADHWICTVFRTRWRGWYRDVLCLILAAVAAFGLCFVHGHSLKDPFDSPAPPQRWNMYYPAIFFAGGHGMGTAPSEDVPGVNAFMSGNTDSFDVSDIPEDIKVTPISTPFELTYLYHIYAVGWFWRIFGVSVASLLLYEAAWHAAGAAALYGLFRNGLGRLASLAGAVLVCSSPALLLMSTALRESAKTPFFFLILCLLVRLVIRPVSVKGLLARAILLGVVLGFGMGFRQDVLICVPPAFVILAFVSRPGDKNVWKTRCAAALLFLAIFFSLARPVFRGAALEGNQAGVHGFFQGLTEEAESRLDFGGASYESLAWTDSGLYAQANVLARRLGDDSPMDNPHTAEYRHAHGDPAAPFMQNPGLHYTGPQYARYQRLLIYEVLRQFPADLVARAWRAAAAAYRIPAEMQKWLAWIRADYPLWLEGILHLHRLPSQCFQRFGLLLVAAVLLAVSYTNLKTALCLTGLLLWFTGYPGISYEYRLIAYLIFLPAGALMMWIEWLFNRIHGFLRNRRHFGQVPEQDTTPRVWMRPAINMILLSGFVAAAFLIPLALLRPWQTARVRELAVRLSSLTRTEVATTYTQKEDRVLVSPLDTLPGLAHAETLPPGETAWEYVAAVFDTRGRNIPVTIEYDPRRVFNDFTQRLTLWGSKDKEKGLVTFFFPVYEATTVSSSQLFWDFLQTINIPQWREQVDPNSPFEEQPLWKRSKFLGISFPESCQDAFKGFYRVTDVDALRYLPLFQLPENREDLRTFKSGPWERWLRAYLARTADREGTDF